MNRNVQPEWIGTGVRNQPESVSGMAQNTQPPSQFPSISSSRPFFSHHADKISNQLLGFFNPVTGACDFSIERL